ncbi:MAG: DMT family transporter [Nitriliruptorales bacterium]|nr:DMT family transporter [Nitriliruptorales bacterium]
MRSTFTPGDAALFLALSSAWGLSFLFIKVSVEALSPLWVVAIRTVIGAAVLLAIVKLRGRRLPRTRTMWWHLFVLATVGNAVPWALVAWAQQEIPSGLAAVVNSLVPASTLAVAAAVGIERLTTRKVMGLLLAFAGTAAVMAGEFGAPERAVALAVVAGATVMYGASAVYAKRYVSGTERPLVVAAAQVLLAAGMSVPAAWAVDGGIEADAFTPAVLGSVTALGALGTGLAFLLFYLLIDRVGATNATMVTYVIPVIGVVAGWLILDERFGWNVLVGGLIMGVGIWLAQRQRQGPADSEPEETRQEVPVP